MRLEATRTSRVPDGPALGQLLREAYSGPAWHGPSLRSTLRALSVDEALWRPAAGRNNVWALVLHAAYAKYRVLRRLDPALADRFARPLDREWWPRLPSEPDAAALSDDQALLEDCHRRLVDAVESLPAGRLATTRRGARVTLAGEVAGAMMHDVYHAGQIRLIRRLYADR